MKCQKCGLECEYLGRLKEDNRKVYACRKCDTAWAVNEIPTTVYGPTPSEIKQFEEDHSDAEACPKCGYKFLVDFVGGPMLAYTGGRCIVCPRLSGETANDKN